jgi:hypothetical protein
MTKTQRMTQQIEWLGELYPSLVRVAQAIIPDSATTAEDLTSDAVYYTLRAVSSGRCTIITRGRFSSYCKNMVRKFSKQAYTRYHGDVKVDRGRSNVISKMRPDRKRSIPHKPDGESHNPYERWETVESE